MKPTCIGKYTSHAAHAFDRLVHDGAIHSFFNEKRYLFHFKAHLYAMKAVYICHTTSYCIILTTICTVSFLGTVRVHIMYQFIFWMITVLTEMLLQNV